MCVIKFQPPKKKNSRNVARSVATHNLLPITLTLILLAIVSALRGAIAPVEAETIANIPTPVGALLQRAGASIPVLSTIAWIISVIYSGLCIGRCGIRFSIYPAYTIIGIPILGIVASCVMMSHEMLLSSATLLVATWAMKYLLRYIMVTDSYGDLSLAMLYFGLLPLMFAPAAILYPCFALMMLLIKPHWRDWVTGITSLIFPLLALCYWSWCAGSGFSTPITECYFALILPSGFTALSLIGGASFGVLAIVAVMVVCSATIYLSDKYSLNGRARVAMRFIIVMIALATVMLLMPSSSATALSLLAIPVSSLVPLMFIKMKHSITQLLWRALLLMVALNIIVLIFM